MTDDGSMTPDERFEALAASMIIGLGRCYDVLICILGKSDPAMADNLRSMHERGEMFFPPPAFVEDDQ